MSDEDRDAVAAQKASIEVMAMQKIQDAYAAFVSARDDGAKILDAEKKNLDMHKARLRDAVELTLPPSPTAPEVSRKLEAIELAYQDTEEALQKLKETRGAIGDARKAAKLALAAAVADSKRLALFGP